jgi:hypothetical protein
MSMKRDSWPFLLACTIASPCLGREPKTRVTIMTSLNFKMVYYIIMDSCIYLTTLFDSKYSKPGMMF